MKNAIAAIALLLALVALPVSAASAGPVTAVAKAATVHSGGKGVLNVTLTVQPGYHVNANKPNDPFLIATEFVPTAVKGITFGKPIYPAAKSLLEKASPKPLLVYQGKTSINVPFTVASTVKPGTISIAGTLEYQACNATSCNPPATLAVTSSIAVK